LDVVNLVKWESLDDVCLVVHSYGGWIGSGALEEIGNRVSSIVWLDVFKPAHGQKPLDFTTEPFRNILQTAVDKGEPSFAPPPKIPVVFVAERDQAFVDSKLTPHPMEPICSRSNFPGRATRWQRKLASASQNFHSRRSIKR
jgi:hypothetical protein